MGQIPHVLALKDKKMGFNVFIKVIWYTKFGSRAVDGKRFHESNASSIPGTYFRLG